MARRVSDAEKAARWCWRNPMVAASLVGIVATVSIALCSFLEVICECKMLCKTRRRMPLRGSAQGAGLTMGAPTGPNITATASLFGVYDAGGARRSLQASRQSIATGNGAISKVGPTWQLK